MGTTNQKSMRGVCLGITATALLATSLGSFAQDNVLEEILVTATKRSESVQDVPMSIGVVTGDMVEKFDMTDLTDLQSFIPSLTVQSTFGNWSVRIRGLGSGVTNLAFDSSVSVFSDGVYCGRSQCLESALMDLERVEVARGPQGALFGKSTIAGAISVISARPTDEFEAYARGGAEFENGGFNVDGMVSGPMSDNVNGRFAFRYLDQDGYIKNTFTGADEPETENFLWRGSMTWDPTETTSFYFKLEGYSKDEKGNPNQLVSPGLFGGVLSQDPNNEFTRDDRRNVSTGTALEGFENNDAVTGTAIMDMDLGEHTLTAIASYSDLEMERYLDVDGVPENFLNTTLLTDYQQYSLEARLLSPSGTTFEYIVGALYHNTDLTTRQYSPFGFFPPAVAPVPVGMDRNFAREADTFSVYGQLTWNVSDRFRIVTDIRYSDEEQDGKAFAFPIAFPDLINPVRDNSAFNQPPEFIFFQTRKDDSLDPSIRFHYTINDDISAYLAFATGSKPGGLKANDGNLGALMLAKVNDLGEAGAMAFYQRFVGQSTVTPADMIAGLNLAQGNGVMDFEDEEADNIEIGTKMYLAGGSATLNIALFQMDFDNLQTSSYDGTRFIIGNAASADIKGIEVESVWQATDSLRLTGSFAYLDAKYKDYNGAQCLVADASGAFVNPDCTDGQENLAGRPLQRTPDLEVNLGADWETSVTDNMLFRLGVSMYYSDSYNVQEDEHPLGIQDSYDKWDVRLALADTADTWEVALIGRNLTDEKTIQHAYEIAGSYFNAVGVGRTMSLEATKRF